MSQALVRGIACAWVAGLCLAPPSRARADFEPDYRVDSGSEEISGEPVLGQQGSYDSWKKACAEWKKDMREMNGKSLITLSCGTPHASRDHASLVTQTSTGTYKIKVRIRDAQAAPALVPPVAAGPPAGTVAPVAAPPPVVVAPPPPDSAPPAPAPSADPGAR